MVLMWRCPSCGWGTNVEQASGNCFNLTCDDVPLIGPVEEGPTTGSALRISMASVGWQEPDLDVPVPRPWRPMWASVQRLHERVIAGMTPEQDLTRVGGQGTVDALAALLISAWHLRDHLVMDQSLKQPVHDALAKIKSDREAASPIAIHIAADFANTYKHSKRERESWRNVWISGQRSVWTPRGQSTRITLTGQVLEHREQFGGAWLARTVVQDWRTFFEHHSIATD